MPAPGASFMPVHQQFEIVDVSSWPITIGEVLGASEKLWLREPGRENKPEFRWLYKPVTEHENGTLQGGDWAEKLASEIAAILEIPAAEIQMAEREGVRGTLSKNVRPTDQWDLYEGGLWLDADNDAPYSISAARASRRHNGASDGHRLEVLAPALRDLGAPPQARGEFAQMDGFGVFCSYLVLDALLANRDRHEQNWSVLRPATSGGTPLLAAAYDHEGSLGFNLTDDQRSEMLARANGIERWANRGTAWRLQWLDEETPTLVEAAVRAVAMCGPEIGRQLYGLLDRLEWEVVEQLVSSIPRMSDVTRTFCLELILINSERLRHGLRDYAP